MKPVIEVRDVQFAYGDRRVLDGLSFDVVEGEFLSVIGPNGSGKTTLLKLLYGYLTPQRGSIRIKGTPIREIRKGALARRIAVVSQVPHFQFEITALELVLMGRSPHMGLLAFEGKEDLQMAYDAMVLTDVADFKERSIFSLSGGEFQRVMIARALTQDPEIMLLDEPTSYLDIRHQINLCSLLKRMNRDKGISMVSVFHDINLASHVSDRIVVMKAGKIQGVGTPEEVIRKEIIESVYECRVHVDKGPAGGRPRVTPIGE